jgi:hypothetical protein
MRVFFLLLLVLICVPSTFCSSSDLLAVIADTTPQFFTPGTIEVDSSDRIYVTESNRILVLAGVNAVDPSKTVLAIDVYNSVGVPTTGTTAFEIDSNGNMYFLTSSGLFVFSSVDSVSPGQLIFNTTVITVNGSKLCTLGFSSGDIHVDVGGVIYINTYCGYPGISSYYGGVIVISGIYAETPGEFLSFFTTQQSGDFDTFTVDSAQRVYWLTSSSTTLYGVYSGFNSSNPWSQLYNGTVDGDVNSIANIRTAVFAVSDVSGKVWLVSSSGFDVNISLPSDSPVQSTSSLTIRLTNPFEDANPILPLTVGVVDVAISPSGRIHSILQIGTLYAILVVRGFANDTDVSSSSTGTSQSISSPFESLTSQLGLTSSVVAYSETSVQSQSSSTGSGLVEVPRYLIDVLRLIIDNIAY